MVATQDRLGLEEYFSIALRRVPHLAIPFFFILAVSVGVTFALPAVYLSTGTISVESQQIPTALVRTTVTGYADERISFIQQRVMTRARLVGIIDKYQLFPAQRDKVSDIELVAQMRERIFVKLIAARTRDTRRQGRTTIAFEVSFEHRDPEIAAKIATELVTLFLAENIETRTRRATETTEFLVQEAGKLKEKVETMEAQLAAYKQEYSNALPEHLSLHINMLARNETELRQLERDINTQREEKRFLEIELESAGSIVAVRNVQAGGLSLVDQLASLQAALVEESAVYGSAHPDVRVLQRKVAALKRVVNPAAAREVLERNLEDARTEWLVTKERYSVEHPDVKRLAATVARLERELKDLSASRGEQGGVRMDSASARIEAQIAGANVRLESLEAQKSDREENIRSLETQILLTPQVERGLRGLSRDYENALQKYEEVRAKHMEAELAESLESSEKAERFILLEPPSVPDEPVKPNRKKLLILGIALALGSGLGSVFIAEIMDKSIRGPAMLTAILNGHPLAVIPYIKTASERRARRTRYLLIVVVLFLLVIGAAALFHFFFIPWDVLFYQVLDEIGTL